MPAFKATRNVEQITRRVEETHRQRIDRVVSLRTRGVEGGSSCAQSASTFGWSEVDKKRKPRGVEGRLVNPASNAASGRCRAVVWSVRQTPEM